jgi:hypothetical protein
MRSNGTPNTAKSTILLVVAVFLNSLICPQKAQAQDSFSLYYNRPSNESRPNTTRQPVTTPKRTLPSSKSNPTRIRAADSESHTPRQPSRKPTSQKTTRSRLAPTVKAKASGPLLRSTPNLADLEDARLTPSNRHYIISQINGRTYYLTEKEGEYTYHDPKTGKAYRVSGINYYLPNHIPEGAQRNKTYKLFNEHFDIFAESEPAPNQQNIGMTYIIGEMHGKIDPQIRAFLETLKPPYIFGIEALPKAYLWGLDEIKSKCTADEFFRLFPSAQDPKEIHIAGMSDTGLESDHSKTTDLLELFLKARSYPSLNNPAIYTLQRTIVKLQDQLREINKLREREQVNIIVIAGTTKGARKYPKVFLVGEAHVTGMISGELILISTLKEKADFPWKVLVMNNKLRTKLGISRIYDER